MSAFESSNLVLVILHLRVHRDKGKRNHAAHQRSDVAFLTSDASFLIPQTRQIQDVMNANQHTNASRREAMSSIVVGAPGEGLTDRTGFSQAEQKFGKQLLVCRSRQLDIRPAAGAGDRTDAPPGSAA